MIIINIIMIIIIIIKVNFLKPEINQFIVFQILGNCLSCVQMGQSSTLTFKNTSKYVITHFIDL